MKRYGYHRTSTREQQTGKNFNRPRYQVLKEDVLRAGDDLIITEVDRLGRNKQETLKELQYYRDNGIRVKDTGASSYAYRTSVWNCIYD